MEDGRHIGKYILAIAPQRFVRFARNFVWNTQNPSTMTIECWKVRILTTEDGGRICTETLRTQNTTIDKSEAYSFDHRATQLW